MALFGPSDLLLGTHVQSLCDALDIPHLEARYSDPNLNSPFQKFKYVNSYFRSDFENTFQEFSLNLHPSQDLMNQAYQDMMKYLNWTRAAILYEDDFGLVRLQDLVRTPYTKNLELYIRQTTPENYRMVLGEIKKKDIRNIIVDTSSANMNYFFR